MKPVDDAKPAPSPHPVQRVLIANRGEIARRAIRTIHAMGHESVGIFAEPDRDATWVRDATTSVCVGPAELDRSYLSIDAILDAAAKTNSTAVFPGYGFMSEQPDFAQAVLDAGLIWVGPKPDVMAQLGDKAQARVLAEAAGLPVVPGNDQVQTVEEVTAAAVDIGYPLLIKARAGGGGRGIRRVDQASDLEAALAEAKQEAARAFGDDAILLEKYVGNPRHIEVQVVADRHGSVIHLGTRECSLQRRYQKVLEEAPAPNLAKAIVEGVCAQAVALASHVGYDSVGTVEYLVDDSTGAWYFLEMNTRLQVEHPVTEAVTGTDIVAVMLASAFGDPLTIESPDTFDGHCFQARITAEDPWDDFSPQTGTIVAVTVPGEHRWDSAIETGTTISPHYDSLIGKLIVPGPNRNVARQRTADALGAMAIGGLPTTTGFLRWLISQPEVVQARASTQFIDHNLDRYVEQFPERDVVRAALEEIIESERNGRNPAQTPVTGPWFGVGSLRLLPVPVTTPRMYRYRSDIVDVVNSPEKQSRHKPDSVWVAHGGDVAVVVVDGHSLTLEPVSRSEVWAQQTEAGAGSGDHLIAPFPASVVEVMVTEGQHVTQDDVVITIEAMKLLHSVVTPRTGTVQDIKVAVGDTVETNQLLLTLEVQEEDRS